MPESFLDTATWQHNPAVFWFLHFYYTALENREMENSGNNIWGFAPWQDVDCRLRKIAIEQANLISELAFRWFATVKL